MIPPAALLEVTYHAGLYLIFIILLFHHHHLRVRRSFDERIEDLKVHKQKHDHLNVKILEAYGFSVLYCSAVCGADLNNRRGGSVFDSIGLNPGRH